MIVLHRHSKRARALQTNMPVVGRLIQFFIRVEPICQGVLDNFVAVRLR